MIIWFILIWTFEKVTFLSIISKFNTTIIEKVLLEFFDLSNSFFIHQIINKL